MNGVPTRLSELDSHDIHEAAADSKASEPSGLGREKRLPGPWQQECSDCRAEWGAGSLRDFGSGGAGKTLSISSVLRQSWSENATQCVHLADGETEASKGAVTQRSMARDRVWGALVKPHSFQIQFNRSIRKRTGIWEVEKSIYLPHPWL